MWWIIGIVIILAVVIGVVVRLAQSSGEGGRLDSAAGRTCDACGGSLRVLIDGTPWVYYHCSSCSKDFCNPCAASASRRIGEFSAACPVCKTNLQGSLTRR
jgi:hypothetical protein